VVLNYPTRSQERAILDAMGTTAPITPIDEVVGGAEILAARHVVNHVYIDEKVRDYIVDLVLATRDPRAVGKDLGGYIQAGASPRATICLGLGARANAFLHGRGYVTPQDVKDVALEVLRHRVVVSYEAEAEDITSDQIIARILEGLPVP